MTHTVALQPSAGQGQTTQIQGGKKRTRHNGVTIREIRVIRGYKPGEFANKAGISYPHLDNIENERKEVSVEVLNRIATALNVDIRALTRSYGDDRDRA